MVRRASLTAALALTVLFAACAVRQSHAPQIPPAVAWELNVASQLQGMERDYRTFFKDVGDAQRAGTLTEAQANQLFGIGHRLKPAIEKANLGFKTWQASKDDAGKTQVTSLILAANQIFLELATRKAQIMTGGGP